MPIDSNIDLFRMLELTVADLKQIGLSAEANDLKSAIHVSSLPGEIFGEVRIALRKIAKSKLPADIKNNINNEISYINTALGEIG